MKSGQIVQPTEGYRYGAQTEGLMKNFTSVIIIAAVLALSFAWF
jgi:hypothetical protein